MLYKRFFNKKHYNITLLFKPFLLFFSPDSNFFWFLTMFVSLCNCSISTTICRPISLKRKSRCWINVSLSTRPVTLACRVPFVCSINLDIFQLFPPVKVGWQSLFNFIALKLMLFFFYYLAFTYIAVCRRCLAFFFSSKILKMKSQNSYLIIYSI